MLMWHKVFREFWGFVLGFLIIIICCDLYNRKKVNIIERVKIHFLQTTLCI